MDFDTSRMEAFLKKNEPLKFLADSLVKSGFEYEYALRIVFNAYVPQNSENIKLYQEG